MAGDSLPPDSGTPRTRRSPLTVLLVACGVLLAGGGTYWAAAAHGTPATAGSGGADATNPPPLALTGDPVPAGTGGTPGVRLKVTGPLPDGPSKAPVWAAGAPVSRTQVTKVAEALRVPGPVRPAGGAWHAGAAAGRGGPAFQVGEDTPNAWSYVRDGSRASCAAPTAGQVCYGAGPDGGTRAGEPVSAAAARRATAPLLAAVGLSGMPVDASRTAGAIRVVAVDPVAGGLPTQGWRTTFQVGPDGTVLSGAGRLAAPVRGPVYPVVSARTALRDLERPGAAGLPGRRLCGGGVMHPGAAGGAGPAAGGSVPDGTTDAGPAGAPATPGARSNAPCLAAGPAPTVTGARFGLSAQFVAAWPELVPSWLFDVRLPGVPVADGPGSTTVLAVPAVDPRFVVRPGTASAGR